MDLLYFMPRWGSDAIPWENFIIAVKEAGYHGIEMGLPADDQEARYVFKLLRAHGLKYILQHYETTTVNFPQHIKEYRTRLEKMAGFAPFRINSHTGKDYFSKANNLLLLREARRISDETGIPLSHETHRSRFSYAAHATRPYLVYSWLRLTWDVSHWFCVAESLLEDQTDVLDQTIARVDHIHARFGHPQGPQIGNPDDPQWAHTRQRHLKLWQAVIRCARQRGVKELSITTEFGPPPYMPFVPAGRSSADHQFTLNYNLKQLLHTI